MREAQTPVRTLCFPLLVVTLLIYSLAPLLSSSLRRAEASPPTAISPTTADAGGLHTIVTPSSATTNICGGNCVITGGTRPGGGTNLFHSFGQFNVGSGDITTFQNGISFDINGDSLTVGLPTSNILGRVTGGDMSTIFGTIQTSGFGSANLFLMNPNGFLFGQNATVNVGGMATFTTANSMRLSDGITNGYFYADLAVPSLLTAASVAAFGFIDPIVKPIGPITVYGMTVHGPMPMDPKTGAPLGQKVGLVGGNITFTSDPESGTPSTVTAPGRQIQITSVAGAGEVAANSLLPESGMALGTVTFDPGTIITTAGDPLFGNGSGGSILIRGGQFVAMGATLSTTPAASSFGSGGDVTVSVTGSATLTEFTFIQTSDGVQPDGTTLKAGPAGAVSITANDSLSMTNSFIDTSTVSAIGNSGPVTLTTHGLLSLTDSFIYTLSSGSGNGGAVSIDGKDVTLTRAAIQTDVDTGAIDLTTRAAAGLVHPGAVTVTAENTVTVSSSLNDDPFSPVISAWALGTLLDAGSLMITGKTVNLSNGKILANIQAGLIPSPGNGGTIEIRGNNVTLSQFELQSTNAGLNASTGKGGSILLRGTDTTLADNIQLTDSFVSAASNSGGGGGTIEFQTKALTLSDHTGVLTSAFGSGSGGIVTVSGAENVTIESGSNITSKVLFPGAGIIPQQGAAGNILLETQNLTILGGGQITATANKNSLGDAGNITVQGTNGSAQSVLIDGAGSGIFTNTEGTGAGGNIFVNANSVTLQNGAALSARTTGAGDAGAITIEGNTLNLANDSQISSSSTGTTTIINPDGTIDAPGMAGVITIKDAGAFVSNASTVATSAEANRGGDISITAQSVQLVGGTSISASSNAPLQVTEIVLIDGLLVSKVGNGNAGDIMINAGQNYTSTDSAVTTLATHASGGNITVLARDMVQLTNSQLNASVAGSSTTVGGNITIDPQYVILQNSQISAIATQGQGGAISINISNGGLFLSDANSTVSATSQSGVNGTVTIQSPNAPISGQIQPLGKSPLIATSLLNQRCAALAGGEFSSFTVAARDSLPIEPGSWLASPLTMLNAGMGLGVKAEGGRFVARGEGLEDMTLRSALVAETEYLSLRQIAPAGFLTQAFAVSLSTSCRS